MIRKLRIKFIALSMMALFVLLGVIVVGMNIINYSAVVAEADQTLSLLAKNRGVFPKPENVERRELPPDMSPEKPYETRYFSVLLDKNGEVVQTDTGKIKAIGSRQAIDYAAQVMASDKSSGFIESYRFMLGAEEEFIRITFLDCGSRIASFHTHLFA